MADYFVSNIPADGHIPVDFAPPQELHIEDSIVAAIAAEGLLELAGLIPEKSQSYLDSALKLLKTISADRYDFNAETDGLLTRCTGSYLGTKD